MQAREIEKLAGDMALPILAAAGLTLAGVEYVCEKEWYLRIFIDKPGGIDIDDCQFVSEQLGEALDARDFIPGKYFLEVSSPGIDKPLQKDEDLAAAYGSRVDLSFREPWEGALQMTAVLVSHGQDFVEIKKISKGRVLKTTQKIDRSLLAAIRPHIDF